MTPPDDRIRLAHLREAAQKALHLARGTSRRGLEDDEVLRLALTKLVEIVGEAAKYVSEPTRLASPAVPWSAAARMRDRLIHHYFDIDLDVLWATLTDDLPALLDALPEGPDASEAHRQSEAVAASEHAGDDQAFIDAIRPEDA
jgi:uncharacterized protein with HEPN domain